MSGETIAKEANIAFAQLKVLTNAERSQALENIHNSLKENKSSILEANKLDLENAKAKNLSPSLIKRLDLSNPGKFDSMLQGILDVANLPDNEG